MTVAVAPLPTAAATPAPRRARLLDARDWAAMAGLMATALVLRVLWWSGFGLGDDFIFRNEVNTILVGKTVLPDNQAYRFAWWFPTALSCRLFGLNEIGLVLPYVLAATVGIGLVYAIGKAVAGRAGAVIAALLLIVHPLDFAWSTMLTNDIMLSVLAAATMVCVLRALAADDRVWRRRLWTVAGFTLWLGFHAKLSAVFLVPTIALVCLLARDRVGRDALCLVITTGVLLGLSLLVAYVFTGDALFAYHSELSFQGLSGPTAPTHVISRDIWWYYPQILFGRDQLGDWLYGFQPHVLVALLLLAPVLRLRTSAAVACWLACMFLGMELNVQRAGGVWISGFRNIRHTHVFVYPLVLLLAGLVASLRARSPRLTAVGLAALLALGAWQSVTAASRTREAFGDRRAACRLLASLPRDTIHADEGLAVYCPTLALPGDPLRFHILHPNPEPRRAELANVRTGYAVTGGTREPYYGCPHCIPRADELPPGRWRLVQQLPGADAVTPWRPEPLRVWEAVGGAPP